MPNLFEADKKTSIFLGKQIKETWLHFHILHRQEFGHWKQKLKGTYYLFLSSTEEEKLNDKWNQLWLQSWDYVCLCFTSIPDLHSKKYLFIVKTWAIVKYKIMLSIKAVSNLPTSIMFLWSKILVLMVFLQSLIH